MPNDCLELFGVRRHSGKLNRGHDNSAITDLLGMTPVTADDAENPQPASLRLLELCDDVATDVSFRPPPPTENTRIASFDPALLVLSQEENTVSQPSSFVRAVSSETLSTGV